MHFSHSTSSLRTPMNSVLRLALISLGMLPGFTRATDFFHLVEQLGTRITVLTPSVTWEGKNLGGAVFSEALPQEVTVQ